MTTLKMQPTFRLDVPLTAEAMIAEMRTAIASEELRGKAVSAGVCVDFMVDPKERRFWSPHLSVQACDHETSSGCQLVCRFSPRPEVWTMVMFVYFLAAFGMCAAAIYAYVQWLMEVTPWALVFLPLGLLVIGALHVASLVGQGLSSDQMVVLRKRFDRAVELALNSATER